MGQPNIQEIEAGLPQWEMLQQLPQEVAGFKLIGGSGIKGQILNIAAYVKEAAHCRLDITYTSETFDYVPVKTVGLHTFRDERFFSRSQDDFSAMFLKNLPDIIGSIDRRQLHAMDVEAEALHFEQWDDWKKLPKQIGDYEMFIAPDNPLPYINGSFIFLDYTDFIHGNQVYFAYNIFRNELFAEMKQHHLPLTTDLFDVKSSVPDKDKLAALGALMDAHLLPMLEQLKNC